LQCIASGFGASRLKPHLLAPLQALAWISAASPRIDAPGRFAVTRSTRYEISQCLPIESAAPLDLERDGSQRIAQLERGENEEQRTDEQQDSGHMRAKLAPRHRHYRDRVTLPCKTNQKFSST